VIALRVKMLKTAKQLEKHFKGIANHRRIEILMLIAKKERISLENIAEALNCNPKTISEHTRKLYIAGLVNKRHRGTTVEHTLSPYGRKFFTFLKTF